jgi:uncharacterized protein (TIGR02266 family)
MPAPTLVAVKTVIVADDTAFVRDRFRTAIENAGHQARTAGTVAELLQMLRDTPCVDLVVLDLRLQGRRMDLLKEIRKVVNPSPPILVFSGTLASADEVRRLSALGVAGYINEYTSDQHIAPSLAPHLFPGQYNRRSSPRVVVGISVAYRFGHTIARALTLNVSKGGVALRTTSPLEAGTEVKVRFRLPGTKKEIDAVARVAWVDRRVGMGLQFVKIAPEDDTTVEQFVQAHFFSNRKA